MILLISFILGLTYDLNLYLIVGSTFVVSTLFLQFVFPVPFHFSLILCLHRFNPLFLFYYSSLKGWIFLGLYLWEVPEEDNHGKKYFPLMCLNFIKSLFLLS